MKGSRLGQRPLPPVPCRDQLQSAVERIQAKEEVAGDRQRLVGLLCLTAVQTHVCSQLGLDKRLTKAVLDLHHKVPCPVLLLLGIGARSPPPHPSTPSRWIVSQDA